MRNRILLFVAATLLSVVGGVQASWAQSVAAPSHPFWQEIGDSVLSRLIVEAQRGNNDVRVAEARLDATRASRRLSAFDLAPTITANGSALRTRQSGAQRFVYFHVLVPGEWTVHRGHQMLEEIEQKIRGALPNATVFTHLESLEDPSSWDDIPLGPERKDGKAVPAK
jgi:hypothetical protein